MIYSKFGTPLTLISKTESPGGRIMIQATASGGAPDVIEYNLADLKADQGMSEIQAAVAALPPKPLGEGNGRSRRRRGL